ncbi:hypothetical protein HBB16_02960 [Pseudonocardia sp. MCCB 268]|nr:hypothetical protein [Pseudonocardia cytotoxica]
MTRRIIAAPAVAGALVAGRGSGPARADSAAIVGRPRSRSPRRATGDHPVLTRARARRAWRRAARRPTSAAPSCPSFLVIRNLLAGAVAEQGRPRHRSSRWTPRSPRWAGPSGAGRRGRSYRRPAGLGSATT